MAAVTYTMNESNTITLSPQSNSLQSLCRISHSPAETTSGPMAASISTNSASFGTAINDLSGRHTATDSAHTHRYTASGTSTLYGPTRHSPNLPRSERIPAAAAG